MLKSLKIEHITLLTLSKLTFYTFFRNKLKSVEFSSSFATRYRSVEIIKKKKSENYVENMTVKELFKFSDRFYRKFAESTFYRCIKARYNEIKSIIERKQLCCIY